MKFLKYIFTFFAALASIHGATIAVFPGQSIQDAINSAQSGDSVLLYDGNYNGDISIIAKDVEIIKAVGARPIINGSLTLRGINLNLSFTGINFNDNDISIEDVSSVYFSAITAGSIRQRGRGNSKVIIADSIIDNWNVNGSNNISVGLRTSASEIKLWCDNSRFYYAYGRITRLEVPHVTSVIPDPGLNDSITNSYNDLVTYNQFGNVLNEILFIGNSIEDTYPISIDCVDNIIQLYNNEISSPTTQRWSSNVGLINFSNPDSTSQITIQNNNIKTGPIVSNTNQSLNHWFINSLHSNVTVKYNYFIGFGLPINAPIGTVVESNHIIYHSNYFNSNSALNDFVISGGAVSSTVYENGQYVDSNESNRSNSLGLTRSYDPLNFNVESMDWSGADLTKTTLGMMGGPYASILNANPYEPSDPSNPSSAPIVKQDVEPVVVSFKLSSDILIEGDASYTTNLEDIIVVDSTPDIALGIFNLAPF